MRITAVVCESNKNIIRIYIIHIHHTMIVFVPNSFELGDYYDQMTRNEHDKWSVESTFVMVSYNKRRHISMTSLATVLLRTDLKRTLHGKQ